MSGVGGVGSAGGASGAGAAGVSAPSQGSGCGSETPGTGSAGDSSQVSNDTQSTKEISEQGEKGGLTINISQTQNTCMFSNMSTQDAIGIHNNSPLCESQSSNEMDLQKLIELMMIMKLLESMNESGGGGFSATG